ncbi:hypothetical protein V7166_22975 [Bacillus thuringiensis]
MTTDITMSNEITGERTYTKYYKTYYGLQEEPFNLSFLEMNFYCLMVDRIKLSKRNKHKFTDKHTKEVYCIITNEEVKKRFSVGKSKAIELLKTLQEKGFVTVKKIGRTNCLFPTPLQTMLDTYGIDEKVFDEEEEKAKRIAKWKERKAKEKEAKTEEKPKKPKHNPKTFSRPLSKEELMKEQIEVAKRLKAQEKEIEEMDF